MKLPIIEQIIELRIQVFARDGSHGLSGRK